MSDRPVQTASGPVEPDCLGRTLMHEHIFALASADFLREWPHARDRDGEIRNAIENLQRLSRLGIDTFVDLTTVDLGRDAPAIAEIARNIDLTVVVSTGFWLRPPGALRAMSTAEIAAVMVHDIEMGIQGTHVRAGVIKCASEGPLDETTRPILEAVALAHRQTGVPISTHTDAHTRSGIHQQDALESHGVDLSRVVIGHSGDSDDLGYLIGLIDRGSVIGMDRFGLDVGFASGKPIIEDERRVATVAELCRRGYADHMVLGQDANCFTDMADNQTKLSRLPNWHHEFIVRQVIPQLLEAGVTNEQIDTMMVGNPRRILSHTGPY